MTGRLCSLDGCDRPNSARRLCRTHYERWRKTGDPGVATIPAYVGGAQHPQWRGEEVGYVGVHRRLVVGRGPASEHLCRCGAPASEWAYDHGDPDERVDPRIGRPYSTDPDRYEPLCLPCHRTLDAPAVAS